jgi:hypothetical protein
MWQKMKAYHPSKKGTPNPRLPRKVLLKCSKPLSKLAKKLDGERRASFCPSVSTTALKRS